MTRQIKSQFKSGWARACERYTQGEAIKQILLGSEGTVKSAYYDGLMAACEVIMHTSCDNGKMRATEYGIVGDEYTALHNMTLDV